LLRAGPIRSKTLTPKVSAKANFAYIAAAILVGAVLVSAALLVNPLSRTTTVTSVSTDYPGVPPVVPVTITTTSTATSTVYYSDTVTTTQTIPAGCPSLSNANGFGTILASDISPAIICVRLYEFASSPTIVNTTSLLSIFGDEGPVYGQSAVNGNFTLSSSLPMLTLGGPNNLDEGTVIAYTVNAKQGASGTYGLQMDGFELVTSVQAQKCGIEGLVVAGTGQPNYAATITSLCIDFVGPGENPELPGLQVSNGTLYFGVVDTVNATQ
jgi:hypothetical protein